MRPGIRQPGHERDSGLSRSNWSSHPVLVSVGYAVAIFIVSLAAQWIVYRVFLQVQGELRWIGSSIAALSTGLFVWRIASMRQKERAAQEARAQAIGEVNHHIRNCLQILVCENFARPQLSEDSVYAIKRIDWTLKNVLPAFSKPISEEPKSESPTQPIRPATRPDPRERHSGHNVDETIDGGRITSEH